MIHYSEFTSRQCSCPCHQNPGSSTTPRTILAYPLRHVKRHEVRLVVRFAVAAFKGDLEEEVQCH